MAHISRIDLCCLDPKGQKQFYCNVLGMHEGQDGTLGYGDETAGLRFLPATLPYGPSKQDLYWKITLAVPDIELACGQLRDQGIAVDTPVQFGDVGYLAHFRDPEGLPIELIDHWFKDARPAQPVGPHRLGGGPSINLLTLRCHNLSHSQNTAAALGLKPLAVVPVPKLDFTLYFYGDTPTAPPNADLFAVENRTWVYQRRQTILEVVHQTQDAPMVPRASGHGGFAGALVVGAPEAVEDPLLGLVGVP